MDYICDVHFGIGPLHPLMLLSILDTGAILPVHRTTEAIRIIEQSFSTLIICIIIIERAANVSKAIHG